MRSMHKGRIQYKNLQFHGTWNATYSTWTESEEREFKKKFLTLDYLKEVFQNPDFNTSHPGLLFYYLQVREGCLDNFRIILNTEEERQLNFLMEQLNRSK